MPNVEEESEDDDDANEEIENQPLQHRGKHISIAFKKEIQHNNKS